MRELQYAIDRFRKRVGLLLRGPDPTQLGFRLTGTPPRISQETDSDLVADLIELTVPTGLISDIGTDTDDRFASKEIASHLAELVSVQLPPFTMSLSGAWGVGKTTLARRVTHLLPESVPVVWIDLWTEDLQQLRRRLAVEVAVALSLDDPQAVEDETVARLDQSLLGTTTRRLNPVLSVLPIRSSKVGIVVTLGLFAGAVGIVTWGASQPLLVGGTGLTPAATAAIGLGTAAILWLVLQSGLILRANSQTVSIAPIGETIALRREFERLVTAGDVEKVLVVLDNLDRLTSTDAVGVLADIRSFVEVRHSRCLFLVPVDREALIRHLDKTLGDQNQAARDFLDKFFGIDILLTEPAPEDLRSWAIDLLRGRFPRASQTVLEPVTRIVLHAAAGSPRAAKRIINGVYTRAYIVPRRAAGETTTIRLQAVAFVEGATQRFPETVQRLSEDPRGWLEAAQRLRETTDVVQRNADLFFLVGRTYVDPPDAPTLPVQDSEPMLRALERFVLRTRDVLLTPSDAREILSARPNRQWSKLLRTQEIEAALLDGTSIAPILAEANPDDRRETLRICVEELERSQVLNWSLGVLRGMNAVAPALAGEGNLLSRIRAVAGRFVSTADPTALRSIATATVDVVFGDGFEPVGFRAEIIARFPGLLQPGGTPAATPLVRMLAHIARDLTESEAADMRAALASLSDEELGPLFETDESVALISGAVTDMYLERLVNWDPAAPEQAITATAGTRLRHSRRLGVVGDDALTRILQQASKIAPETALPEIVLQEIVQLALTMTPSDAIDGFARALLSWSTAGTVGIQWALDLPTTPGSISGRVREVVDAALFPAFETIVGSRRGRLEELGIPVAQISATRWAAGKGEAYAELAVGGGAQADVDATVDALGSVADHDDYLIRAATLASILGRLTDERGGVRMTDGIQHRIDSAPHGIVARLAAVVSALPGSEPTAKAIDSIESRVRTSTQADLEDPALADLVRQWFVTTPDAQGRLVTAFADAIEVREAVDIDTAVWLSSQRGAARAKIRVGVLREIERRAEGFVLPSLGRLRAPFGSSWRITDALVRRAAAEPPGKRLPWLQEALHWDSPPSKRDPQPVETLRALLVAIAANDQTTTNAVQMLLDRLPRPPQT